MRLLLVMNGSRARYAGGADQARYETWLPYCGPGTKLEIGYLPDVQERYEFGTAQAATKHSVLYPGVGQVVAADHLHHERVPGRLVHRLDAAEHERKHQHDPGHHPGDRLGVALVQRLPGDDDAADLEVGGRDPGRAVAGLEQSPQPVGVDLVPAPVRREPDRAAERGLPLGHHELGRQRRSAPAYDQPGNREVGRGGADVDADRAQRVLLQPVLVVHPHLRRLAGMPPNGPTLN